MLSFNLKLATTPHLSLLRSLSPALSLIYSSIGQDVYGYSALFTSGICLQMKDVIATPAMTFCLLHSSSHSHGGSEQKVKVKIERKGCSGWWQGDL